ncbi:DUF5655 domain-containing protein, partial [Carnobacterium viridans]
YLRELSLSCFQKLRKWILNLDSSVTEKFFKKHIAYTTTTNFVDIVPQKRRLRINLNIQFEKISDPRGMCKDVTNMRRWGHGYVEVGLSDRKDLDYIMI